MKQSRFMERLADTVASHPRTLLALLAVVSAFLAFQLRNLTADPSPRALLASADPEQEKLEAQARTYFGSTDNVIVVVLSGNEVLQQPALEYEHKLAAALLAMPHAERVDALTRVVWPKRVAEQEGTLDDLDAVDEADEASPNALGAAADLVAARSDVFPNGVASLAEKTAGQKLERLVPGEHVTAADVSAVRAAVEQAKQLSGRLISRDHKHLAVAVGFSDAVVLHSEVEAIVQSIERWLLANPPPAELTASLSGLPVVRSSLVRHMRKDQRVLIPGTLIASFIVLALSFRWWPAVVLPVIAVGVTALWLLGGMALVNERLNVLNNMLPALVIIIGLNEAVHIIGRYMEEHTRLGDKRAALHETIRAMGAACLMTTLTSAIGMAALLVSRTEMLRRFGLVGAVGLLLAYAVTLLVVPSALSLLKAPPAQSSEASEPRGHIERWMSRTTAAAMRHPWWVVIVAALFTAAAGFESARVIVDSNMLGQFGRTDPVRLSTQLLEEQFEGVRPLEITLSSETKGRFFQPDVLLLADRIAGWAARQKGVLRVTSPSEPLSSVWTAMSGRPLDVDDALRNAEQIKALAEILHERDPRILGPVLTPDGTRARVRVKLSDIGSKATTALVSQLREQLDRELMRFPELKVSFGGDAYVSSRGLDAVVSDLSGSVAAAAVMIFLLLALLLGDLRLALLAIPANLLPQVWTMAWMAVRDIPLNASSAIIFSLSIGLAVDGSIHLISRYQEERVRSGLVTVALVRAVRGTGRNIVVSSAALVLGFSVMLMSSFVPVQRFGELITVSMAGCVIATLIIQPVLIRFFASRTSKVLAAPRVLPS
jgi:predicted RND superfamily exporter protein